MIMTLKKRLRRMAKQGVCIAALLAPTLVFAAPDIRAPFIAVSGNPVLNRPITLSADVWNAGAGTDMTNAYRMVLVGGPAAITNRANYVSASGAYAFTASTNGGSGNSFEAFTIADPKNPLRVAGVGQDFLPYGDTLVVGDLAYVAYRGGPPSLRVIRTSELPTRMTFESGPNISRDAGTGLAYRAPFLFVSGFDTEALQIYDISGNPSAPAFQGSAASGYADALARAVAVNGTYAYVLGSRSSGGGFLEVFDVTFAIDAKNLARFPFSESFDVALVSGGYLYAGHFNTTGFSVFSLADPANPVRIKTITLGAPWAGELALSGRYLHVGGDPYAAVYDISDPANPVMVSRYTVPESANDSAKFATANFLYHASDDLNIYEPHVLARFCVSDDEYSDADRDACMNGGTGRVGGDLDGGALAPDGSATLETTWTATLGLHTVYFCADVKDENGFDGVAEEGNEGGASNCISTEIIISVGALFGNDSGCTIAIGEQACTLTLSWATTDALDPRLVNRKTGEILSTDANAPTPFPVSVSFPTTVIDLRDGAAILDTEVLTGTCAIGSEWDGSICAPATLATTLVADPSSGAPPLETTLTASTSGNTIDNLTITNWTISYATPASDIASIAFDALHGVLYAGSGSYGIIYRCDTATLCDEGSDWTEAYDAHGPGNTFKSLVFDQSYGVLYAGTSPGGNIYRCDTTVSLCSDTVDWRRVARLDDSEIATLMLDATRGVLYAGTGEHGMLYRCDTATRCNTDADWKLILDTEEAVIMSFGFDRMHGVLYAGTRQGGIIYRCNAAATSCDDAGDWRIAYDTPDTEVGSFTFDTENGILYAGTGNSGVIYRCNTKVTLCREAADWRIAFDTASGYVSSMAYDPNTGVVYAGTGGTDHGIIYRCDTQTPGSCNDASDWTLSEGITETVIRALAVDTMNGPLYAGSATNGIIYRSGGNETVSYHFWWNCSVATNVITTTESVCGALPIAVPGTCVENAYGARCAATTTAIQDITHTYSAVGTYIAKVIVEAGNAENAEARTTILLTLVPKLSVTPERWDFGEVYLGDSETRSFMVENVGQPGSFLEGRAFLPSDLPAHFICVAGCGPYPDLGLPFSEPHTVTIRFTPRQTLGLIGPVTARFSGWNTIPAVDLERPVYGTGVLPLKGARLDFGNVVLTREKELELTIENRGLTVFSDRLILPFPGTYTCIPSCDLDVPARDASGNGTQILTIRFKPPAVGDYSGNAQLLGYPIPTGPAFPITGAGVVGTFKFKDQ